MLLSHHGVTLLWRWNALLDVAAHMDHSPFSSAETNAMDNYFHDWHNNFVYLLVIICEKFWTCNRVTM